MNILLGVTGSIAAVKIPALLRALKEDSRFQVEVVLTRNGQKFLPPLVVHTLNGRKPYTDLFTYTKDPLEHIHLARWADLILVAPASAHSLAKIHLGFADNLLTNILLASGKKPLYIAPAMNTKMWESESVQGHVAGLKARGAEILAPKEGVLACEEIGAGRIWEAEEIYEVISRAYVATKREEKIPSFKGVRVLMNAGATEESIDPVRYISNRSSGKMGFALSAALADAGAQVRLIYGHTQIPPPSHPNITSEFAAPTEAMFTCLKKELKNTDLFIAAAAITDYRVRDISTQKIKKSAQPELSLHLVANPDILAYISRQGICSIGFFAETQYDLAEAEKKRKTKNLALAFLNEVHPQSHYPFGADTNTLTILSPHAPPLTLPNKRKEELAFTLLPYIRDAFDRWKQAKG